ncbi:MAG: SDR family NAD(P)-dependent oxidoreductase [Chloroflexota bacterium]|nr:SDR family NAD(P)-dependent oxidoreductase [Chloroflexota bacterium]
MIDLKDRVAIVTGGASGIGRGICLVLAECGADVVVADIDAKRAEQVAAEVQAKGRKSMAAVVDVTKPASVDQMVKDVLARFGRIDILVNDAGVVGAPGWVEAPTHRVEDWDAVFEVNVKGVVIPSVAVAEHMKQRRSGKIVNIASGAGRQGSPGFPHYSASKAAVISWTQAHAAELGPYNVNVNCVCPGVLWTPMWETIATRTQRNNPQLKGLTIRQVFEKVAAPNNPLGREQTPEDVGKAVAFFASDDARNITGQALNVNAGSRMN